MLSHKWSSSSSATGRLHHPASEYVVTFENNVDASDNAKIIVTNAEGGNLIVPTISTTFTIKPAPLTITVSNVTTTKQYDGSNATTFDSAVEGVIEGTDPQYEVNVTFDNANVGTGKTITATYSVANSNYVLTTNSEVVTTSWRDNADRPHCQRHCC